MKRAKPIWLISMLLVMALLAGCGGDSSPDQPEPQPESQPTASVQSEAVPTVNTTTPSLPSPTPEEPSPAEPAQPESPKPANNPFRLENVPAYSGQAYVALNENTPYFDISNLSAKSYENYSPLDALGRCGTATACIGQDLMPTEERGSIGQVKPSGWHTVRYDCVDGKYLYNRCHLIGYQLTAENANTSNLITGTRYLNIEGMLPFENMTADYIKETGNRVEYHVTPVFEGDNLLASGVLMEGYSVEDQGDGVCFCVFAYNVQPGVTIDYATGDSALDEAANTAAPADSKPEAAPSTPESSAPTPEPAPEPTGNQQAELEPQGNTYILNTNTKKFHYPSCSSVKQMKESNKQVYTGSREDIISQGYDPCKRCNP